MFALLLSPKAWTGLLAGLALAVVFYEGAPLGPLRLVPGVGPLVASIVDGRVDRSVAAAIATERAKASERALELIRKWSEDNAEIGNLDDAGLCRELGGVWLPDERRCD